MIFILILLFVTILFGVSSQQRHKRTSHFVGGRKEKNGHNIMVSLLHTTESEDAKQTEN